MIDTYMGMNVNSTEKQLEAEKKFRVQLWIDHEKLREELDRAYTEINGLRIKLALYRKGVKDELRE